MQPKHPWLQKCLERLEQFPQIQATATTEPYLEGRDTLCDGLLTITTPQQILEYVVEIKPNVTLETFPLVIEYLNYLKQRIKSQARPLLVTDTLSDTVVNLLIEKNIEFIETKGYIYLNNSSLYILSENHLSKNRKKTSVSVTNSTLKIAYFILKEPTILADSPQVLANTVGVDVKTVKRNLETLYKLNYLQRQRGGKYRVENYTKLLERWEMGYIENLRSELLIGQYSSIKIQPQPLKNQVSQSSEYELKKIEERRVNNSFSEIVDHILNLSKSHQFLIGGEMGAAILTGYLQPISAVLYLPESENYRMITAQLKLKPDPTGNLTLLKQFWNKNFNKKWAEQSLVDPLLIHAELTQYPDERLKETARRIYNQYLLEKQIMVNWE